MVRYPEKKPSEPVKKPQAQGVSSGNDKVINEKQELEKLVPKPGIDKEVKDEQVEELHQRLHFLEEKLENLQKSNIPREDQSTMKKVRVVKALLDVWQNYRIFFIILAGCGVLTWGIMVFTGQLYVAGAVLELKPMAFNVQGAGIIPPGPVFAGLEQPPGLFKELQAFAVTKVTTVQEGEYIKVQVISWGPQRTRQLAQDWQMDFEQGYGNIRKHYLELELDQVNSKEKETEDRQQELLGQMSGFRQDERYFLVNGRTKQKLTALAQNNAINFERDLIDIKEHLGGGIREGLLQGWTAENKSLLGMYSLKLTDMEFRKFLVSPDFANTYDEGMRAVKKLAAQLINKQAQRENIDEIATSLIIKDFFLSCRFTALEALLNKRYVASIHELSGRLAQYIRLKEEFEAIELKREIFVSTARQIKAALSQGFLQEVVIRSPLKVGKF